MDWDHGDDLGYQQRMEAEADAANMLISLGGSRSSSATPGFSPDPNSPSHLYRGGSAATFTPISPHHAMLPGVRHWSTSAATAVAAAAAAKDLVSPVTPHYQPGVTPSFQKQLNFSEHTYQYNQLKLQQQQASGREDMHHEPPPSPQSRALQPSHYLAPPLMSPKDPPPMSPGGREPRSLLAQTLQGEQGISRESHRSPSPSMELAKDEGVSMVSEGMMKVHPVTITTSTASHPSPAALLPVLPIEDPPPAVPEDDSKPKTTEGRNKRISFEFDFMQG